MYLASNLQYLRRNSGGMTQEKLAQRMGVSRQTISKWESGEAYPEIGNLMELCDIFSCKLDQLLREDMRARRPSPIRLVRVDGFRMIRYVLLSPRAEQDLRSLMMGWAGACGLSAPYIHWGFPYVSADQKNRFGLSGHGGAYILPEEVTPVWDGAEVLTQKETCYAVMTLRADENGKLPKASDAYRRIMEYLADHGVRKSAAEGFLPAFQRDYWKDGVLHQDVFVHCEGCFPEERYHFD